MHSYYVDPPGPTFTVATTDYGPDFASVVARGNVFGVQFHPEKSQGVGAAILRNFVLLYDLGSRRCRTCQTMIIYPAIDLRGGRCVRLRQGRADQATVFSDDPAAMARRWADAGAAWLHVVNLDGAFGEAAAANRQAMRAILQRRGRPRPAGRRAARPGGHGGGPGAGRGARRPGHRGADAAEVVGEAIRRFGPERVAVGIDAWDGMVAVRGWQQTSAVCRPGPGRPAA